MLNNFSTRSEFSNIFDNDKSFVTFYKKVYYKLYLFEKPMQNKTRER